MAIEIFDYIFSRLRLRELGFKMPPLDKNATLTEFDVEDSFITLDEDLEIDKIPPVNLDSEPE